ncbi:MAG: ROK family protein [Candidatus Orphnella occulta]|nr:ROK family protein [Candidatus Orphnella occulta]MDP8297623.1 ROK family protein [Candidatus Orphnella occulta]
MKKVFDEKDQPIEIGYSLFSGKYLEIDRQKILIADHYKGSFANHKVEMAPLETSATAVVDGRKVKYIIYHDVVEAIVDAQPESGDVTSVIYLRKDVGGDVIGLGFIEEIGIKTGSIKVSDKAHDNVKVYRYTDLKKQALDGLQEKNIQSLGDIIGSVKSYTANRLLELKPMLPENIIPVRETDVSGATYSSQLKLILEWLTNNNYNLPSEELSNNVFLTRINRLNLEGTHAVKRLIEVSTIGNKRKNLITIDETKKTFTIKLFSADGLAIGSIDYLYSDGVIGEIKGWSIDLGELEYVDVDGEAKACKKFLSFDYKKKIVYVELRDSVSGLTIARYDGDYSTANGVTLRDAFIKTKDVLLQSRAKDINSTRELFSSIEKDFLPKTLMELRYGSFKTTEQIDCSKRYMSQLEISVKGQMYFVDPAKNKMKEPVSVSGLYNIIFDEGVVRAESIRKDMFDYNNHILERYALEIRDARGYLLELQYGKMNNGIFIPSSKNYMFYKDEGYGRFGIADKTVFTVIENDLEHISSYSNTTVVNEENGNITYRSRRGLATIGSEVKINYDNLKVKVGNIEFVGISNLWRELKNNKGRLLVIMDGYPAVSQDFWPVGDPNYITFLTYDTMPYAISSKTYKYEGSNKQYGNSGINTGGYDKEKALVVVKNPTFTIRNGEFAVEYDVKDDRPGKGSIKHRAIRVDGRLFYEFYAGMIFRDPDTRLYYNERELPDITMIVEKDGKEILGSRHYVAFLNDKLGYIWVYDKLLATGDMSDLSIIRETELMSGAQINENMPRINALPSEKASKLAQRDATLYFLGERFISKDDVYTTKAYGREEDGKVRIYEGYLDFFRALKVHIFEFKNNIVGHISKEYFWQPYKYIAPLIIFALPALIFVMLVAFTYIYSRVQRDIFRIKPSKSAAGPPGPPPIPRFDTTTPQYRDIEKAIGPSSVIPELVNYLVTSGTAPDSQIMRGHRDFWRLVIDKQMNRKLGSPVGVGMRDGALPMVDGRYVLDVSEINDYFYRCRTNGVDPLDLAIFEGDVPADSITLRNIIEQNIFNSYRNNQDSSVTNLYRYDNNEYVSVLVQKVSNAVRNYLVDQRKQENVDSGIRMPLREEYPIGFLKSFAYVARMLSVIKKAARLNTAIPRKAMASRFYKLIFWEWAASTVVYIAVVISYVILSGAFVLPALSAFGLIPIALFMILNLWVIVAVNYSALFVTQRQAQHLDNTRNWSDVTQQIRFLTNNNNSDEDFVNTFKAFTINFVKSLQTSSDQPGRGPLISQNELDSYLDFINQPGKLPNSPSTPEAYESFKHFINKWMIFYHSSRSGEGNAYSPDKLNELKSKVAEDNFTIMHSGFDEKIWTNFDELDMVNNDVSAAGKVIGKQVISKFQKLMMANPSDWELFIRSILDAELNLKGLYPHKIRSAEKAAEIISQRSGLDLDMVKVEIEKWANWRLEGAGKTLLSTINSNLETYMSWAEVLDIDENQRREWALKKFRVIFGYGAAFAAGGWNRVLELYPDTFEIWDPKDFTERDQYLARWRTGQPRATIMTNSNISGHASKVGSWGNWVPFIDTEIVYFLDVGHRLTFDSVMFTPVILDRFRNDPSLGMVSPVYVTYYETYTPTSTSLARGHEVWDRQIRSVKGDTDSDNDFGKKFVRLSAYKSALSYIPEKNSEDTAGGNKLIQAGYNIEHTEIVDVPQSVEKVHFMGRSFVQRFGATVPELMAARGWWEFLADRNVHWTLKIGTLISFSHYVRIAITIVAAMSFIILNLFLPWSPFINFPLLIFWAVNSFIANQAINSQQGVYLVQRFGLSRGFWEFYKYFWVNFFSYVSYEIGNVYQYIKGFSGINEFSLSPRISDLTRVPFNVLFKDPSVKFGIKAAAILLPFMVLMPISPLAVTMNILFVLLVFIWASPFLLNQRVPFRHNPIKYISQLFLDIGSIPLAYTLASYELLTLDFPNLVGRSAVKLIYHAQRIFSKAHSKAPMKYSGFLYSSYYARKYLDRFKNIQDTRDNYLESVARGAPDLAAQQELQDQTNSVIEDIEKDIASPISWFKILRTVTNIISYSAVSAVIAAVAFLFSVPAIYAIIVGIAIFTILAARDLIGFSKGKLFGWPEFMAKEWSEKIAGYEFPRELTIEQAIRNRMYTWVSMVAFEEYLPEYFPYLYLSLSKKYYQELLEVRQGTRDREGLQDKMWRETNRKLAAKMFIGEADASVLYDRVEQESLGAQGRPNLFRRLTQKLASILSDPRRVAAVALLSSIILLSGCGATFGRGSSTLVVGFLVSYIGIAVTPLYSILLSVIRKIKNRDNENAGIVDVFTDKASSLSTATRITPAEEAMLSESEYSASVKASSGGISSFKSFRELEAKFERLKAEHKIGETVTIAFDRGAKVAQVFAMDVPKIDSSSEGDMSILARYIVYSMYNRAGAYGAERILINCSNQLFNTIRGIYDEPVDGNPEKGLHLIGKYFELVYQKKFEFVQASTDKIESLTQPLPKKSVSTNPYFGNIVGIDIGKSDIKAVACVKGVVTASDKFDWSPESIKDTQEHIQYIRKAIKSVIKKADLNSIDGIGISINLAVNSNQPTGLGPVLNGVTENGLYKNEDFKNTIHNISSIFSNEFNVPVYVLNDGDAAAVQVSVDMKLPNTLALSLGSGLAGGFVDSNNMVTDWLTEMGNIIIDIDENAVGHSFSKVKGAAQQYLSQRSVFRLAEKSDLELEGDNEAAKLRYAQQLFTEGTEEQKTKVRAIFKEIATYVAEYAIITKSILGQDNMVLFGRVTEGESGKFMLEEARRIIAKQPVAVNIIYPNISGISEEQFNLIQTHGQAIGASYYASQNITYSPFLAVAFGGPDGVLIKHDDFGKTTFETSIIRDNFIELLKRGQKVVIVSNARYHDVPAIGERGIQSRIMDYVPSDLRSNITIYASNGTFKIEFNDKGNRILSNNYNDSTYIPNHIVEDTVSRLEVALENYWSDYQANKPYWRNKYPTFKFKKPYIVYQADNDGRVYCISVLYLPSSALNGHNLSVGEDSARKDILFKIEREMKEYNDLFWDEYTLRESGLTSIDIRKRNTGKDHAIRNYMLSNSITPEGMVFLGNLKPYSEDLPIENIKGMQKIVNDEYISGNPAFGYIGRGIGGSYAVIQSILDNKDINAVVSDKSAVLDYALKYLDVIISSTSYKNLTDYAKIRVLHDIYEDFRLAHIDAPSWISIYVKGMGLKGDIVDLLKKVENEYNRHNNTSDYFKAIDRIFESHGEQVNFIDFYEAIDPRAAKSLSLFRRVYRNAEKPKSEEDLMRDIYDTQKATGLSITRVLVGYFQDWHYQKFKESVIDTRQSRAPPIITYFGGGGKSTTTLLQTFINKGIERIACAISSSDDGGSSWNIMESLFNKLGNYFIPPGDAAGLSIFLSNDNFKILALFLTESMAGKLPADITTQGRITGEVVYPVWDKRMRELFDYLSSSKKMATLEKITGCKISKPDDFIIFWSSLLSLGELLDRELIMPSIIELNKASTPNLMLIGAAYDAGVISKKGMKPDSLDMPSLSSFLALGDSQFVPVSVDYERSSLIAEHEDGHKTNTQTLITDMGHKDFITKMYFGHRASVKEQSPVDVESLEYPQATEESMRAIEDAEIVVTGNGSLWTSIMPVFLYKDLVEKLLEKRKNNVPIVYIAKIKSDLETSKGVKPVERNGAYYLEIEGQLSLGMQLEAIRSHVSYVIGRDIKLSEIFSHIIIPEISENTKAELSEVKLTKAQAEALSKALEEGQAQVSKYVKGIQPLFLDKEEQLTRNQGIEIVKIPESRIEDIDEKAPIYDNEYLSQVIMDIHAKASSSGQAESDYKKDLEGKWSDFVYSASNGLKRDDLEYYKTRYDITDNSPIPNYNASYSHWLPEDSSVRGRLIELQREMANVLEAAGLKNKIALLKPESFHITLGIPLGLKNAPYSEETIQSVAKTLNTSASKLNSTEMDIRGINIFQGGVIFAQVYPIYDTNGEFEFDNFERYIADTIPESMRFDGNIYHITLGFITTDLTSSEARLLISIIEDFRSRYIGMHNVTDMELDYYEDITMSSMPRVIKKYTLADQKLSALPTIAPLNRVGKDILTPEIAEKLSSDTKTSSSGMLIRDNMAQLIEGGQLNFDIGSKNIEVAMNRLKDLNGDEYEMVREALINTLQNKDANMYVREMTAYALRLLADRQVIEILTKVAESPEAEKTEALPVNGSIPKQVQGMNLAQVADYSLQHILTTDLFKMAPDIIAEENQAVIVYSDALMDSKALQEILNSVNRSNRKYYLVNKSDMSNEALLKKTGIPEGLFERIFVENNPEITVDKIMPMLAINGISQIRVFALEDRDKTAWSRQNIVDVLLVILKSKEFEIMTPDERNRKLYEKEMENRTILIQA